MISRLEKINEFAIDTFHHIFFKSETYALHAAITTQVDIPVQMENPMDPDEKESRRNEHDISNIAKLLRDKVNGFLQDWLIPIAVKAQRNVTINL